MGHKSHTVTVKKHSVGN